jgi:hypothetical protein
MQAIAKQVLVGEFILYKPVHANITNAVTTSLHFIIDGLAAFIVAILVYVVRALQHHNLLKFTKHNFHICKASQLPLHSGLYFALHLGAGQPLLA